MLKTKKFHYWYFHFYFRSHYMYMDSVQIYDHDTHTYIHTYIHSFIHTYILVYTYITLIIIIIIIIAVFDNIVYMYIRVCAPTHAHARTHAHTYTYMRLMLPRLLFSYDSYLRHPLPRHRARFCDVVDFIRFARIGRYQQNVTISTERMNP